MQPQVLRKRQIFRLIDAADVWIAPDEHCKQADRAGEQPQGQRRSPRVVKHRTQSAFSACFTSSTWPETFTLCHALAMVPSLSIRKVARSIPMYFRP